MPGLSLTLETAKSTLLNTQVQIQVNSHNIANAENKSYARQKAILGTSPANLTHAGWIGTGATIETIVQMRDAYIEQKLMNSMSAESHQNTLATQLSIALAGFSDSGETGISQALGAFWDSWDALLQDPEDIAAREGVYLASRNLSQNIRTTYADLDVLVNSQISEEIQATIDKANSLLDRIANLNHQIQQNESPGHYANDLRDSRYQALKELAEIMPIQYGEEANGSVTVRYSNGTVSVTLVSGPQASPSPLHYDTVSEEVTLTSFDGGTSAAEESVQGGILGGLTAAREDIQAYMDRLNAFAGTLIDEVNGAYGSPVFTGSDARDVDISPDFLDGPTAAELSERALQISNLQEKKVSFGTGGVDARFIDFLGGIQSRMGGDLQEAETQAEFYATLRTELDGQQQSISGVSLDEEMVDLLKHQQIYQAATKIIQQTLEMLNRILDIR